MGAKRSRPSVTSAVAIVLLRVSPLVGLTACSTQGGTVTLTSTPASEAPAAEVICATPDDAALAVFDGVICPWVLVAADAGLRLETSAQGADGDGSVLVRAPPPCVDAPGRCRWEGTQSALGPALLAIVEGPESEHPIDVWFGIGLDGEALRFVDLWWGEASVVDRTEVGPIHTLAPYDCGGLTLLPEPRLPEATYAEPDPQLVVHAGAYAYSVQEDRFVLTGAAPLSKECKPLWSELP